MTLDEVLTRIDQVMGLTPHGIKKTTSFYDLAAEVAAGCILELGCYRGIGTLALVGGARPGIPVYPVDDYITKTGWIGDPYGPENEAEFHANMAGVAGYTLVKAEVTSLAETWAEPAGLIVWDIGQYVRMLPDFWRWEPHLLPGGVFALRDIDDQALGSNLVVRRALESGRFENEREWPGFIWSVTKCR